MSGKHTENRIGSGGAGATQGRLEHTAGESGQSLGAEEAKKHSFQALPNPSETPFRLAFQKHQVIN